MIRSGYPCPPGIISLPGSACYTRMLPAAHRLSTRDAPPVQTPVNLIIFAPMLSRFVAAIPVNGTPVQFEFHTMNVKQLQLFQVYVMHEGKKARFHVQIDENSEFKITDEESCPAPYRDMSKAFSDAIYAFYAQG